LNPKMDDLMLTKPDCGAITVPIRCNVLYTNGWCQWDDSALKCTDNFEDALFLSSVDLIGSKSVVAILCALTLCLMLKAAVSVLSRFSSLEQDMVRKCTVYAVEVVTGSVALYLFVHCGHDQLLLSESMDTSPANMATMVRGLSVGQILVMLYVLELVFIPKMRSMLQLHHIVATLTTIMAYMLKDHDFHVVRFMALTLGYFVTEQNVFIQLLFYRLGSPRPGHWIFHFFSLCLYAATRVFLSVLFWRMYVIWCLEVGRGRSHLYYVLFAVAPILNILMNIAQTSTVSALYHITNKVRGSAVESEMSIHVSAQSSASTVSVKGPVPTTRDDRADGVIEKSIVFVFFVVLGSALFAVLGPSSKQMECGNIDSFSDTIFGEKLDGILIAPTDHLYDAAKYQYAESSYPEAVAPSFILMAKSDDDIHSAISFSKHCGYKVAVRSGGHQYSALSSCNGRQQKCIQIDLSHFNHIAVDDDGGRMTVGVGNTLMETIAVHNQMDTFLPHGTCLTVGIGGHWQTGGMGMISPIFGAAIEYLVAFDVILSDHSKHSIVRPQQNTSDFNDDLFYAVLGGGPGSWGVVTQFEVEPLRADDYSDSSTHLVVWSFNKDVLRFLMRTLSLLSDQDSATDHSFFVVPRISPDDAIIVLGIIYVDFPGRSLNQTMIDSIINGANQIEHYMMRTDLSLPMIQMTANELIMLSERREFDLPYYRKSRVSTTTVSEEWIDELVDLWTDFVEIDGIYGNLFLSFGAAERVLSPSNMVSLPWRDMRLFVGMDMFYDPEIANYSDLVHRMDSAWNRWLVDDDDDDRNQSDSVLFGDGVDRRMWAFTDGDLNISNVWPFYIESEDKYDELRRIKTAVDGIDLFSNQFTIPPFKVDDDDAENTHRWSLTAKEIVALIAMGLFLATLLLIGLGWKWCFGGPREPETEKKLAKTTEAADSRAGTVANGQVIDTVVDGQAMETERV